MNEEWTRLLVMVGLSILGSAIGAYASARKGTIEALKDHESRIVRLETVTTEPGSGLSSKVARLEEHLFPMR